MDHLLETAYALLPGVVGAALGKDPPTILKELADRCGQLVSVRTEALRIEQDVARRGARKPAEKVEKVEKVDETAELKALRKKLQQGTSTWLKAPELCKAEFLADALAERPGEIFNAITVGAPNFYPSFLAYLVETAVECAQSRYHPETARDRVWWYVWSWFAASEYAAQLRERYERVARELAKTDSWRSIDDDIKPPEQTPPDAAAAPSDGARPETGFSASMLGAGHVGVVKDAVEEWLDKAQTAVGWKKEGVWKQLSNRLGTEPETRKRFIARLRVELLGKPDLVGRLAEVSGAAVPFDLAFAFELEEIRRSREMRLSTDAEPHAPRSTYRAAADMNLFGVALSGGGIRSATFNLGVLQGLASNQLLRQVDYLSTVSGGGYVGAWLASWIKRMPRRPECRGVQLVEDRLRTEPIANPDDDSVRALRFLREYSNYLTPRVGVFSADTWTMIAIWLRNTLLIQSVLILALAGMLMTPWAIWYSLVALLSHPDVSACVGLRATAPVLMTIVTTLLVIASAFAGQQLRRFGLPPDKRMKVADEMLGQGGVIVTIVVPVTIAAFILAIVLCSALPHFGEAPFRRQAIRDLTLVFVLGLTAVAIGGRYWACFLAERIASTPSFETRLRSAIWATIIIALAVGLASLSGAALIVGVAWLVSGITIPNAHAPISVHMVAFTVPVLVIAMSFMVVLKIGLLGRNLYDEHREWWSRLGAWLNIVSLAWLALFVLSLYSPYVAAYLWDRGLGYIAAAGGVGWAAWTAAGVLLAKSGTTSGLTAMLGRYRVKKLVLATAPYVFILGLLALVSALSFFLIVGVLPTAGESGMLDQRHWTAIGQRWHWIVFGPLGLAVAAFLLSCRVDVNEFSMHHFYKNRLVRCYLGAARDNRATSSQRTPDPFTGFDAADDLRLADLQLLSGRRDRPLRNEKRQHNPQDLEPYVGPIPIVNTALNLVTGDDLAWQERKAQAFAFTPFYSGYEFQNRRNGRDDDAEDRNQNSTKDKRKETRFAPYGFRPTVLYGYPPFGIGTGTAIAISGAAANPNMGYHSSPAASFLMTMFNARLGWWMGNPRDKYNWLRSGPRRGLLYLLNELFGLTNDRTHFVNLSDGGHFENLGIYELARRRCRYIIACDAEQDDELTFNGLANAIRKCRMDLGVEISVRATRIQPAGAGTHSSIHCVIGDITYPNREPGTLLYLKASVTGDEPADVLEYKARQPAFPHHSTTGDQFFDESQFESYRKLGVHIVQTAFAVPSSESTSLTDRFGFLRDYWYPAASAAERNGHASQYEALLDRVRRAPSLDFIDQAFFAPTGKDRSERQELFVGASMLDLMQRVFMDLDLEHDSDHPHNAGWMAIFEKWMQQDAVRKAWVATGGSYGRRFQRFVDQIVREQDGAGGN